MKKLSIIVPCYNEEESIPLFYEEIKKIIKELDKLEFELLFVDDGSKDKTLEVLRSISKKEKYIKYISFSKNFGKESAMYAGLQNVTGDYVTIMDADLQHPPKMLIEMYNLIKDGEYDCIAAKRKDRKGESSIKNFFARRYYNLINKISKTKIENGASDYRLMTRQVVNSILQLKEYNRYTKGIYSWVGYNTKYIEYSNVERQVGNTKWSFWKLFLYSLESIVSFSTIPLAISFIFGLILGLVFLVLLLIILITNIRFNSVIGIIDIITLYSSIQLICIGILGQYLSKAYTEVKDRPIYIIKEKN